MCAGETPMKRVRVNHEKIWTSKIHKISHGSWKLLNAPALLVMWNDKHCLISSVNTTCSDHKQLEQDEQWWHNEAKPQISGLLLLRQLLAEQHLTDQLQTEHSEHPEETQDCQALLVLLVKTDGYDGCEVCAEAVGSKQWDKHHPPAQRRTGHVSSYSNQHAEYQQCQQVEKEFKSGKAQPLDQFPQGEQHRRWQGSLHSGTGWLRTCTGHPWLAVKTLQIDRNLWQCIVDEFNTWLHLEINPEEDQGVTGDTRKCSSSQSYSLILKKT